VETVGGLNALRAQQEGDFDNRESDRSNNDASNERPHGTPLCDVCHKNTIFVARTQI